jgi:hypothetical protein
MAAWLAGAGPVAADPQVRIDPASGPCPQPPAVAVRGVDFRPDSPVDFEVSRSLDGPWTVLGDKRVQADASGRFTAQIALTACDPSLASGTDVYVRAYQIVGRRTPAENYRILQTVASFTVTSSAQLPSLPKTGEGGEVETIRSGLSFGLLGLALLATSVAAIRREKPR